MAAYTLFTHIHYSFMPRAFTGRAGPPEPCPLHAAVMCTGCAFTGLSVGRGISRKKVDGLQSTPRLMHQGFIAFQSVLTYAGLGGSVVSGNTSLAQRLPCRMSFSHGCRSKPERSSLCVHVLYAFPLQLKFLLYVRRR